MTGGMLYDLAGIAISLGHAYKQMWEDIFG